MSKHFYQSKKFWAAIIAAIVAGAREYGVDVPVELLWVIVAYIGGQGLADAGSYLGKNMPKGGTQINLPQSSIHGVNAQKIEPSVNVPSVWDIKVPPPRDWTTTTSHDSYTQFLETGTLPRDSHREFDRVRNSVWMLTDITNPAKVREDFLGHYEAAFEAGQRMYEDDHGRLPDRIVEPCQSGDWSYSSRWLWHSWRELIIQTDMVEAVERTPALKYKLGGLGYLLHGYRWEDIPKWAQDALSWHIVGMKPVWRFGL